MTSCPHCQHELTDAANAAGVCPHCHQNLSSDDSDKSSDSSATFLSDDDFGNMGGDEGLAADSAATYLSDSDPPDASDSSQTFLSNEDFGDEAQTIAGPSSPDTLDSSATFVSDADFGNDLDTLAGSGEISGADSAATFISDDDLSPPSEDSSATFISDHDLSGGSSAATFISNNLTENDLNAGADALARAAHDPSNVGQTIKTDSDSQASETSVVVKPRLLSTDVLTSNEGIDYRLGKLLGEGGMGLVYEAIQTSIGRNVALKMLKQAKQKPITVQRSGFTQRTRHEEALRGKFLAEAIVTGDLEHPNIVPIYDVARTSGDEFFYAMKKVHGTPWQEVIDQKSRRENLDIWLKVVDAIAYAHDRGVIHRDLKPENVMLGAFGEVLVMDWGLAMPTRRFRKPEAIPVTAGTGGTPAYMAPEMLVPGASTEASDIYLLGAMLFQIVTGHAPHPGKSVNQCLIAVKMNQIRPTKERGELIDIATKAMSTEPKDRHASAQELQQDVRDYLSHTESITLAELAQADLERAESLDQHDRYADAISGFKKSIELWPENGPAHHGLMKAQLAYAASALKKGDYNLAASLLDAERPEHHSLYTRVARAIEQRKTRQRRMVVLRNTAVALVLLLLFGGSYSYYEINRQRTTAITNADEAVKQRDIADEQRDLAKLNEAEAERQALIARENADEAKRQATIADQNASEAKRQATIAQQNELEANRQTVLAKQNADEAKRQATIAQQNETEATRQAEIARQNAYLAEIGLAAAKIDENAYDDARQILKRWQPNANEPHTVDLRHWEWYRLWHLVEVGNQSLVADQPLLTLDMNAATNRLVIGGSGGNVRLVSLDDAFNAEGPASQIDLPDLTGVVNSVALSHDGQLIAVATDEGPQWLSMYDAYSGELVATLDGHNASVNSVKFSPDGRWLLSASSDRTIRIWDVASRKQQLSLLGHYEPVWTAAFNSDGSRIVSTSQKGWAIVWSSQSGDWIDKDDVQKTPPFTGHEGSPVYAAAFSPDGEYVVTGGYDHRLLRWRPEDIEPFKFQSLRQVATTANTPAPQFEEFTGDAHTKDIRAIQFSPDGRLLLTGADDNTLKVWDTQTRMSIATYRGHSSHVRGVTFADDGKTAISVSEDASVRRWQLERYEEIRLIQGRGVLDGHDADAVLDATFSADGSHVITAGRNRIAKGWDVQANTDASQSAVRTFQEGHAFLASSAVFFDGGRKVVTSAQYDTTRIWDVDKGTQLLEFADTGPRAVIGVSRDESLLVTGGNGYVDSKTGHKLWEAKVWKISNSSKPLFQLEGHVGYVCVAVFSPDDRWLFTADEKGDCRLWDVASHKEVALKRRAHSGRVSGAVFLPGGRTLLTSGYDGLVRRWDVSAGDLVDDAQPLAHDRTAVLSMALSPDGKRLLTASEDRHVRMWDPAGNPQQQPVELGEPASRIAAVNSIAISSDGKYAATLISDPVRGSVRIWNLETGRQRAETESTEPFLDATRKHIVLWAAIFTPDGKSLMTIGGDAARLWDLSTGHETMNYSPHRAVASVDLSSSGRYVITGSWDRSAKIWDFKSGHGLRKLSGGHTGQINTAVASPRTLVDQTPDFEYVLTASADGTAVLWSASDGTVLQTYRGHDGPLNAAAFSPDGSQILTVGDDGTARLWRTDDASEPLAVLREHQQPILCGTFSHDGNSVVTGSADKTAILWDINRTDGQIHAMPRYALRGHTSEVTSVAFAPQSDENGSATRVLTGSGDYTVKLWDVARQESPSAVPTQAREVLTLTGHTRAVTAAEFDRTGRYVLTASEDGKSILWLAATQQE